MRHTSLLSLANLSKVVFFLFLLILCNKIKIPFGFVPFTLGTFAVLLIGYFNKPTIALLICSLYLIAGLIGLPVFSNNESLNFNSFLEMKSGGYILGFIIAAYFISLLTGKLNNPDFFQLIIIGIIGHIIIVAIGYFWLCRFMPQMTAFWNGVYPFIIGALIKTILAAFLTWSIHQIKNYYVKT